MLSAKSKSVGNATQQMTWFLQKNKTKQQQKTKAHKHSRKIREIEEIDKLKEI